MISLICFVLAVLASPFKSKSRLEAENAVLRHQLIVLRRKVRGQFAPPKPTAWSTEYITAIPLALTVGRKTLAI
jgi:hypothetical protein